MTALSSISRWSCVLAVLAAASCAPIANDAADFYDARERHPIVVEPQMRTMRVPYAERRITPDSADRLARFTRDYLETGTGAVTVAASRAYGDAPDAVADRLVELGVPADKILLGTDEAAGTDVTLSYIAYTARAPQCGNWSVNTGYTASNTPPPNFGCATQHNIAAMVADPRDLIEPAPMGPPDATRNVTVLRRYRAGEPTPAVRAPGQTGAVSQVGQ